MAKGACESSHPCHFRSHSPVWTLGQPTWESILVRRVSGFIKNCCLALDGVREKRERAKAPGLSLWGTLPHCICFLGPLSENQIRTTDTVSHSSGRQIPKSRLCTLPVCRIYLRLFQALVAAGIPWPVTSSSQSWPPWLYCCLPYLCLLLRVCLISGHLENSGSSPVRDQIVSPVTFFVEALTLTVAIFRDKTLKKKSLRLKNVLRVGP